MKTLKNLLISGSLALASACSPSTTKSDFDNSAWANAYYNGEVWSGYMGENIPRSVGNWNDYQWYVGLRNGQGNNGYTNLNNYKKNRIELPDLDGDGFVTSGNRKYPKK